jgi:hypothetical protein
MKTLAVLLALVVPANAILGQGKITFANTGSTMISTNAEHFGPALGPTAPYPGTGGNQFFYGLFGAPSTTSAPTSVTDPEWTFLGFYATNTTHSTGGRLVGGIVTPPYASGTTYSFLVRGWASSIAGADWIAVQSFMSSFETNPNATGAQGQLFGTSSVATMTIGGDTLPAATLFGTTPGSTIQGFLLDQVPTPEPSAIALAGLASSLLLLRQWRRKSG